MSAVPNVDKQLRIVLHVVEGCSWRALFFGHHQSVARRILKSLHSQVIPGWRFGIVNPLSGNTSKTTSSVRVINDGESQTHLSGH
jgi:hypothetical protein